MIGLGKRLGQRVCVMLGDLKVRGVYGWLRHLERG